MNTNKGNTAALVAAIAAGRSLTETAQASNLSVRSVQRRLHEPSVQLAIEETRADLTRQAVAELTALRDLTFGRLREVLSEDHDIKHVLSAAELVLRHLAMANNVATQETLVYLEFQLTQLQQRVHATSGDLDE